MLQFGVEKCNNATSNVVCAWFGHEDELLYGHLNQYNLVLGNLLNYVDHGAEVEPFVGPVKTKYQLIDLVSLADLKLDLLLGRQYSFIEHEINLKDDLFQIMNEPK